MYVNLDVFLTVGNFFPMKNSHIEASLGKCILEGVQKRRDFFHMPFLVREKLCRKVSRSAKTARSLETATRKKTCEDLSDGSRFSS